MWRKTPVALGGGDKSMFAIKRRVIFPIPVDPVTSFKLNRAGHTTDPMKETRKRNWRTAGELMTETLKIPKRLEGRRARNVMENQGDLDFNALMTFVSGASLDQVITGRRFKTAYEQLTKDDDVFVWLCMVAMAVLNPGDLRSRLMYRHLEALSQAVLKSEMTLRTAFRFYQQCVRSPAYRQVAAKQLQTGNAPRVVGICAAAEVMRNLGANRRPMTAYYQLFQRITERSEAFTPWGFPPLYQFEDQVSLEKNLRFFSQVAAEDKKKTAANFVSHAKVWNGPRCFWKPPTWRDTSKWAGPWHKPNPGIAAD